MTTAAVILAAGQGTRMKSARPKVLHRAAGLPLVGYPMRVARELGCSPVVLVVGHGAAEVQDAARLLDPSVRFASQSEQKGTAHAVLCAREAVGQAERVWILYGDCPLVTLASLQRLQARVDALQAPLGVITAVLDNPAGYGRLLRGPHGLPTRVVEHKDCDENQRAVREVNAGTYLVDRAFLWDALARVGTQNAQREFYLPDIVELAAARGEVPTVVVPPEEMMGVNTRAELAAAEGLLFVRNAAVAMGAGVSLKDPRGTFLDSTVTLDADVTLGVGVQLQGQTRLESGAVVDGPSVLKDAQVGAGAHIKAFSHVEGAVIGRNAVVGPYARLRPETVLEEDVHVGNFVETKKAILKRGAKANHLTYLGDASVGEKSNVGAGTITCNYDGAGKHHTEIGAGVFIGSDSVLVAPLKIGDGAYVAAGSVLTDEVPKDALALGRARQVNKAGRGEQIRQRAKQKAGKA